MAHTEKIIRDKRQLIIHCGHGHGIQNQQKNWRQDQRDRTLHASLEPEKTGKGAIAYQGGYARHGIRWER